MFSLAAGCIYLVFGVLQVIASLGFNSELTASLLIPSDTLGGFVLMIIGSVFIFGFKELYNNIDEGVSFLYVGILISLVFAGMYVLIMIGNAFGAYVIQSENFKNWVPLDDLKPSIYLSVLSVYGYYLWKEKIPLTKHNR